MVDGGDNIVLATWGSTSNIIHIGGTNIGSARCTDFKDRPGRLRAAKNLTRHGITNLIAIGGDGSLTGANIFRQEWPSLLRELVDKGEIPADKMQCCAHLNIVGLVGSIDNDFCGTDMTIGVDSALHRITEAVDKILTTAVSHKRAFVLEIMGRMCGYLPLVAGISSEATTIFIPEDPPQGDWRQSLCDHIRERSKSDARRTHLVLVAEGAIDRMGNSIRCVDVQRVLTERMNMDVRVTVLGHVQRGGKASAFDRIIATRMGTEAVFALMDAKPDTPACVICLDGMDIVRTPLMKAVEATKMVGHKMNEQNFEEVVRLRGRWGHFL
ncbi:ATP-dependent 6-phosphofructokinase [Plakobranchus ocellatus]|uniref:6-phosphofructokinase n=1 Tax=Plakobranchus ocellatus TaxID=259542 RepID=A0AAV4AH62_9GAST|nr:ATP-dependent 6-phosphofructokinase [Plakobranchus ocellatus]